MYPRVALGFVVLGVLCLVVGTLAALSLHGFEGEVTGGGQAATDAADPAGKSADRQDAARRAEGRRKGDATPAAEPSGAPARMLAGAAAPAPESPGAQGEEQAVGREQAGIGGVPPYSPVGENVGDGVREIFVETAATGEPEMRRIASDLLLRRGGEGNVLLVEFHRGAGTPAEEETGFALAFPSKEAALAPDLSYSREEVDAIFEEEGGVRAVSYQNFSEENPALADDLGRVLARQ